MKQWSGGSFEDSVVVRARADDVFAFIDDHARFSSHMSQSSWMMGGGTMTISTDDGKGRRVGSHILMGGSAFGMSVDLNEIVTEYDPPHTKAWETVGTPKLIVVGNYQMKIVLNPAANGAKVSIRIDYDLPPSNAWLGRLFGQMYAKWCVRQMIQGVAKQFR